MFTPELDLRAIQIFLAVAEGKSVKKASEKLKNFVPGNFTGLKTAGRRSWNRAFFAVMFVLYD